MKDEASIIMYIHPTCATSYSIIKYLYEKNLIDRIKIINTSMVHRLPGFKIWSVPWVVRNNKPVATDPVDGKELEALIEGNEIIIKDLVNAFMSSVLHSVLASAIAALHSSIRPVIDVDLLNAATRGMLEDSEAVNVINELSSKSEILYEEWRERIARALSISFVRDVWWSHGGQLEHSDVEAIATPGYIGAWLIAKAGIGRIALPDKPLLLHTNTKTLNAMSRFIRSNVKGLVRKIEKEQKTIIDDGEYWNIINRISSDTIFRDY